MPPERDLSPRRSEPEVLEARYEIPLQWEASVDSTNARLLSQAWTERESFTPGGFFARCLLADHQSEGRGRQGKIWYGAPGSSLLMSLSIDRWRRAWPNALGGFSIASALCLIKRLEKAQKLLLNQASVNFGLQTNPDPYLEPDPNPDPDPYRDPFRNPNLISDLWLKWPNDVLRYRPDGALCKIAGILIETRQRGELSRLVIGTGINLLPPSIPATDAQALPAGGLFSASPSVCALLNQAWRLALARALSRDLLQCWMLFELQGLAAFQDMLQARDVLKDKPLMFQEDPDVPWFEAIGDGIDADGHLRIRWQLSGEEAPRFGRIRRGSIRLLGE